MIPYTIIVFAIITHLINDTDNSNESLLMELEKFRELAEGTTTITGL